MNRPNNTTVRVHLRCKIAPERRYCGLRISHHAKTRRYKRVHGAPRDNANSIKERELSIVPLPRENLYKVVKRIPSRQSTESILPQEKKKLWSATRVFNVHTTEPDTQRADWGKMARRASETPACNPTQGYFKDTSARTIFLRTRKLSNNHYHVFELRSILSEPRGVTTAVTTSLFS